MATCGWKVKVEMVLQVWLSPILFTCWVTWPQGDTRGVEGTKGLSGAHGSWVVGSLGQICIFMHYRIKKCIKNVFFCIEAGWCKGLVCHGGIMWPGMGHLVTPPCTLAMNEAGV